MVDIKKAAFGVWQAFGSRDPERIRSVLTEDARWVAPANNATQAALGLAPSLLETADGIVSFLTEHFRRLFPDGATFDFTNVYVDGSTVIFEQRMRAKLVNGRDYDNRYCWIFEMDGERVRQIREYMDTYNGHRMIFGTEPPAALV